VYTVSKDVCLGNQSMTQGKTAFLGALDVFRCGLSIGLESYM